MLEELERLLDKDLSFLKEAKILIAISGGLDSVVLTHLSHQLKLDISLAHCNFNLRAEESDGDEEFVIDLSDTLGLEVFVENFDTEEYAKKNKLSIQMAARELRYNWFEELSEQLGFQFILTAHHADDSLETFLINLSRGTGLDGLTGIPQRNDKIVRPLLSLSRNDIEAYAKEQHLKWREDSSNTSDKYLRNALRQQVVPKLMDLNPQLLQNFKKTMEHISGSQDIVSDRIKQVTKKVMRKTKFGKILIKKKKIKKLTNPKAYLYLLLKDYGFTEWNDILGLLEAQSGKQVQSTTHRLISNRKELILSEIKDESFSKITIEQGMNQVGVKGSSILLFEEADALFGKVAEESINHKSNKNVIHINKDLLNFPLTVRGWEEGDYFYPFRMKGKKKLSKFFKDEKLSLLDKEESIVLCSGEDIVWVINQRMDDRFKVTDKTKEILKITYKEC